MRRRFAFTPHRRATSARQVAIELIDANHSTSLRGVVMKTRDLKHISVSYDAIFEICLPSRYRYSD